ncbi:dTDP-4-dehydrorhamnose 3,5-epimerase family protein [Streptosporangium sp. DT93]|uniref:dTDP-4-dehydrorhamnose 3,5-epimerase family protein n=1 Tax=Streptosporangium sp. DT93 TaxID=3393428 RepID=UPI003CF294A0
MTTMRARELAVAGAYEFTPPSFADERGVFVSPHHHDDFVAAVGHPLFPVAQSSYSSSRRGVVRGVHFALTPPGVAKYVYCPRGQVLDMVVDTRVGSPTYGRFDAVVLDQDDRRALYFPVGVGHAFVSLEDDSVVHYLLSGVYVPENELAISALDPALDLPVPRDVTPILSERDRVAPTLAEAAARGLLPDYAACRQIEKELRSR